MREKLQSWVDILRGDVEARRNIYMLSLAMAVVMILVPLRSGISGSKYIVDSDNSVVGIERRSEKDTDVYNLRVAVQDEKVRDVTISMRGDAEVQKEAQGLTRDQKRDIEISGIITEIEASSERRIDLPDETSDGKRIKWYRNDDGNSIIPGIMAMYLVIICLIVRDSLTKKLRPVSVNRDEIIRGLPRFVNQIVMMMDSGMILSDSLARIGISYSLIPEDEQNYFEKKVIEIIDDTDRGARSTAELLHDCARVNGVKEMIRITTILIENERRGSNARDTLRKESEFLWESRKIIASEKGKTIDTKMALPLALLLIILIAITMAPALMAM